MMSKESLQRNWSTVASSQLFLLLVKLSTIIVFTKCHCERLIYPAEEKAREREGEKVYLASRSRLYHQSMLLVVFMLLPLALTHSFSHCVPVSRHQWHHHLM